MVVSKQSYVALAPWLNTDLADRFRSAFIDAGLMTDWHASFQRNSGVEHRVLKLDYQPGKRFGTQYFWFAFEPAGGVTVSLSFTWSLANNFPTGTRSVDYVGGDFQSYNAPSGFDGNSVTHRRVINLVNSTTATITRYTSGIKPEFTCFFIKAGTTETHFFLMPTYATPQPWIDWNVTSLPGYFTVSLWSESDNTSHSRSNIGFNHIFGPHRSAYVRGGYGSTNDYGQVYSSGRSVRYTGMDSFTGAVSLVTYPTSGPSDTIVLPVEKTRNNPDLASDVTPVFADIPYSLYLQDRLPVDFGLCWHFTNSTMESQDIFQVTPSVEEWEIIVRLNRGNSSRFETGSPMFMARVV